MSDQLTRAHRVVGGGRLKFHVFAEGGPICGTRIEGNWAVADRDDVEDHAPHLICRRCLAKEVSTSKDKGEKR